MNIILSLIQIKTFFILIISIFLTFNKLNAGTLDQVKERGYLNCGISEDFIGFASLDDSGNWHGFDIDFCKAIAAAIFGDSNKIKFITTNSKSRFPKLALGEIDVLIRNTTWSFSRDTNLEFEFAGINFYDGQTFMVPKSLDINKISDLNGASICVVSGTSNELNTQNYFKKNSIEYVPIPLETFQECQEAYIKGLCDTFTADLTVLSSLRVQIPDSYNHTILSETISKEPLGPVVRHGDDHWEDIVNWVLNIIIIAEEKKINPQNINDMIFSEDAEILRILGEIGNYGDMIELDEKWAYNVINQVGNYENIYNRNIGPSSVLGIENRGLNNLWSNGGILYAPPFR